MAMNDLAKQIFDDASAQVRAQAELAHAVEQAPRVVYLLWHHNTVIGVCGTMARAEKEGVEYAKLKAGTVIRIEPRVVHS